MYIDVPLEVASVLLVGRFITIYASLAYNDDNYVGNDSCLREGA